MFKSNSFFTKYAKHQIYIHVEEFYPYNSTDWKLLSSDMYL